ncbi:MAG: hypothetical protein AB7K09_16620, partial [Planctomycetota bacterium]
VVQASSLHSSRKLPCRLEACTTSSSQPPDNPGANPVDRLPRMPQDGRSGQKTTIPGIHTYLHHHSTTG